MYPTSFAPTRLTAAVILTLAAGATQAADITWTTGPTFNGPNGHLGILTNGSLVEAVNLVGNIGGFTTVDPGGLNIAFGSVNSIFFNSSYGSATGGGNSDTGWAAILNTFEWQTGSNVTTPGFLSRLSVGNSYQVQFFMARGDTCCGTRKHWLGDGNGHFSDAVAGSAYTSIVGTFTADASLQTVEFFDSTNNPILNAYVLRDLTPAVPEPEAYAMMLAGLGLLGFTARRRQHKSA